MEKNKDKTTSEAKERVALELAIMRMMEKQGVAHTITCVRRAFSAAEGARTDLEVGKLPGLDFATNFLSDLRWVTGELIKIEEAAEHMDAKCAALPKGCAHV
jgi:hypothetical protein